ncbi:helix-turn-helix domain-containing protein [Eubacterium aggregans]|uniref:helix-turn-helix domain-containing protein n=1 Tax=Eubacterium aggregans TaxID=81409 RepID=UPI003F3367B6
MTEYVTEKTIRLLREDKHLTQRELADQIAVSDKAVSKWETGRGLPDITLLEPLALALGVSVAELLSG